MPGDDVRIEGRARRDYRPWLSGELFPQQVSDHERRFGAQLVEVGFDTLQLSVPVPPATPAEALPPAAEHAAFCPDQIHQGAGSLTAYAAELVGAHQWHFWWD
ncbi:DUF4253 domain-containing protein [Kitasatospora sp. NPDC127059]|uniref:DUF4253 domain-containing protein n=1 Tax=unclassified Kitasatospora TaxID=2633591 RepID=UPI00366A0DA9